MTLDDMLEQGITIQGRFVSVIDWNGDTVFHGDGEELARHTDECWARQDIAYIYPSRNDADSIFIELR